MLLLERRTLRPSLLPRAMCCTEYLDVVCDLASYRKVFYRGGVDGLDAIGMSPFLFGYILRKRFTRLHTFCPGLPCTLCRTRVGF